LRDRWLFAPPTASRQGQSATPRRGALAITVILATLLSCRFEDARKLGAPAAPVNRTPFAPLPIGSAVVKE
jgi:hypothetical protein